MRLEAFIGYAVPALLLSTLILSAGGIRAQQAGGEEGRSYANPLRLFSALHGPVESCADPELLERPEGDPYWYMYCTTDPLNAEDRQATGDHVLHLVPTFRSPDLVSWEYTGDVFDRHPATDLPPPPASADPSAVFWAPEAQRIGDRFYLFFAMSDVRAEAGGEPGCDEDSAIGYATAGHPLGPWKAADAPLVAPRRAEKGCNFFWTLDPEVFADADGRHHILYGSFHGGIEARELLVAADGSLKAPAATAVPIAIPNRYEAAEVVYHEGFYYLFASATNCCNGPQTGYAVFVGRSESPLGPFRDRNGAAFLDAAVGGTPVIAQNGNRWIGTGHNVVFVDRSGRWWTLYHAVDEDDPYFAAAIGFTKRPVLLDPIDWVAGWPVLSGGAGPSEGSRPAPATDARGAATRPAEPGPSDQPGEPARGASDEFDEAVLNGKWRWLRPPDADAILEEGTLRLDTHPGDLREDSDDAPVLLTKAPDGDYLVEARVQLDIPAEGCCFNHAQAGLVVHGDDDNYVKLVVVSIGETRQTEFARERGPVPDGYPAYGNTVIGAPGGDWTWLRLAVRRRSEGELYTAYTSRDGAAWVRGGSWTHDLGKQARLGLVAMGRGGHAARFDYVRTARLRS
jgi:arabinan endo-1,5-alpha-L-arabinosidase